jgi:hypothetical protein
MRSVIHAANRIVVKVGSSLVTNDGKGLDLAALARWAAEIAELKRRGKQVVLVSSGAIAEGCQRLGWSVRPKGSMNCRQPLPSARWACVRPMKPRFALWPENRANPADPRRPGRPHPLPECAHHTHHPAQSQCRPHHQ